MNNPSPLQPQSSLLEQKNQGRARVKIAVFVVLAIHGVALLALLIQGCQPKEANPLLTQDTNTVTPPTFTEPTNLTSGIAEPPALDPNQGGMGATPYVAPTSATPALTTTTTPAFTEPSVTTPSVPAGATEYKIAKGDNFSTLAKKFKVSVKAITDANPGVDSSKLKIGQSLQIPAPTATSSTSGGVAAAAEVPGSEQVYSVKSGDTLSRIATAHHVSLKALRAANSLKTDRITVGQKLKIPAKSASAAPADTGVGMPAPASGPTSAVPAQ